MSACLRVSRQCSIALGSVLCTLLTASRQRGSSRRALVTRDRQENVGGNPPKTQSTIDKTATLDHEATVHCVRRQGLPHLADTRTNVRTNSSEQQSLAGWLSLSRRQPSLGASFCSVFISTYPQHSCFLNGQGPSSLEQRRKMMAPLPSTAAAAANQKESDS